MRVTSVTAGWVMPGVAQEGHRELAERWNAYHVTVRCFDPNTAHACRGRVLRWEGALESNTIKLFHVDSAKQEIV